MLQPFPRETTLEAGGNAKGVAVAIVTDNRDDSGQGRIKVRFPWYEDPESSHWARVVTPMAGARRGIYFIPEIDDEVLVAFERGDMRFPYIVGGLWSGRDPAPQTNADGKNDIRMIETRKGHKVTFNDGSKGLIRVELNDGKSFEITDDHIEIKDTGGNSVTMDSRGGKITVVAATKLELQAPQVEVAASATMKLSAGTMLTIESAMVKIN
ncbi:MAG: phage tail protein [Hyphomicrobiales bacterium]|nr:MAG: phage tail protein [Hyphomicrobiales bacterium]